MKISLLTLFFVSTATFAQQVGFKNLLFERTLTDGSSRQLNVSVFYPAANIRSKENHIYITDNQLVTLMKAERYLGYPDETIDRWSALKTSSFEDADVSKGSFPLVFILHGRGSSRISYTYIAEEISKYGYIVAIPDFPGSGLTILKDGTKAGLNTPPDLDKEIKQISDDVLFLKTALPANDFFHDIINTKNIGIIGHSLGTMAMFNTLLIDNNFKAAINSMVILSEKQQRKE